MDRNINLKVFCTCCNAFPGSRCLLTIPANSAQSEEERLEMEEYSDVKWKKWAKVKEQLLVKPLEQMICGGEDVETVWERLREADTQSDVCGKVFKAGETCYNCKVGFGVKK